MKKIIYDFNRISNRLLRVDVNDYSVVLKKFLDYVESTDLIWAVITDAGEPSYDVSEEVREVNGYNNNLLDLGTRRNHQYLSYPQILFG